MAKKIDPISNTSLLAFNIEYKIVENKDCLPIEEPQKLYFYGKLNNSRTVERTYRGSNCVREFLLYLFANFQNYKKDSRESTQIANVFSFNSGMKELKSVYKALYELTGREARLIGDINNLKCASFENIRFLDFQNYFECDSFS